MSNKQRGTLTNRETGLVLTGERLQTFLDGLKFHIDGTSVHNYFYDKDWVFAPEVVPFPEKLGSVIHITKWGGSPCDYRAMLTKGGWHFEVTENVQYTTKNLEDLVRRGTIEWEQVL